MARAARLLRYGLAAAFFNALFLALVAAAPAERPKIVVLGDSLTAGYGLDLNQAFPRQLQQALALKGVEAEVVNAGVSGDTSAGGLARIGDVLAQHPTAAIVELGANDALRGLDPERLYANLDQILTKLDEAKVRVLVAGMRAPPNLGREYGAEFESVYARLAEKHHATLYPFFLDGVAADPSLTQQDGLHPTGEGVSIIVQRILPSVLKLLGEPA